jgi:hypothetical protein
MTEKFSPGRESEKKMPCEVCGKLDHSTENCPHLTEEERRRLREKRQQMEKNIRDIEKPEKGK